MCCETIFAIEISNIDSTTDTSAAISIQNPTAHSPLGVGFIAKWADPIKAAGVIMD
jgi:hypothetical protein